MRLNWVRALPRGLWGRPGVPELCRSLCQRPARAPAEGGDTAGTPNGDTAGTPKPRGPQRRHPPDGDTARGDTAGGAASGTSARQRDSERGPEPREQRRGALGGGTSSGGGTSGGDTFKGGTSRSDTFRGGTFGGDTFRSDTFRADTSSGGDTFRGDTSAGDTFRAGTSEAASRRRPQQRGEDPHGDGDAGDDGDDGDTGAAGPAAFAAALRAAARGPAGRGGRLALVEAALAAMPALGAERSLPAYNALLRLLPRGRWVPRGAVQRLLFPFPRQQECGLRLLEQMERFGVVPDAETRFLLLGVFGPRSRPVRKVQRMMFWLPRFRQLDPHPLPPQLPPPGLGTARLGLQRIATEPGATVTVIQRPVPDSGEDEGSVQPYIVSSQSPEQRQLLALHDPARPVFVEGPFPLWLRGTLLKYFVLRGDPLPPHLRDPPPDPERSFYFPLRLELELERGPWDDDGFDVDEVEEGPVFALCVPGAADRRTLARWISALQPHNPVLGRVPVVFRLAEGGDPPGDPQTPQLGTGTPPAAGLEPPEGQEGGQPGGDPPKSGGE